MINTATLQHLTVRAKLFAAMKRAQREGFATIYNRKGEVFLNVVYVRGNYRPFVFLDCYGKNVSIVVLDSLKLSDYKTNNVAQFKAKHIKTKFWHTKHSELQLSA